MTHEHMTDEELSAFVDGELGGRGTKSVREHLVECHACALRLIEATELKNAIGRAGRPSVMPTDVMARLTVQVKAGDPKRVVTMQRLHPVAWMLLAASLLVAVGLFGWRQMRAQNALTAELLDQHLVTLSSAATPEVVSSDKHTVKPWFQGKLPFSFNLPEPAALPNDTALLGGDLAYVDGQPAALLLFRIHKHQVSVFVTERGSLRTPAHGRSGFSLHVANAGELQFVAVSDVNPTELDALLTALVKVQ